MGDRGNIGRMSDLNRARGLVVAALEHFHARDKPGLEYVLDEYGETNPDASFENITLKVWEVVALLEAALADMSEPELPHEIPDDYQEA